VVALTAPLDPIGMDEDHMGDPVPLPHEPRAGPQGDRRRGISRAAARRIGGGLLQLPGGGLRKAAIRPLLKLVGDPSDDEARRPDCWLVIEAEIDHAGPGPRVASRGDRMGRRLIFGSYRIDAAQQWSSSHVLAATCELDFNNICCELGGVGPTYRPRYIERL
jgi:hypothetical protein